MGGHCGLRVGMKHSGKLLDVVTFDFILSGA